MIFCFSGTGNSRYIARRFAEALKDTVVDLNAKIKAQDNSLIQTGKDVIIVVPTYAWRIPRVVSEWLTKTELASAECPACPHLWTEPGGEGSKTGQRCCLCRPTRWSRWCPGPQEGCQRPWMPPEASPVFACGHPLTPQSCSPNTSYPDLPMGIQLVFVFWT